MPNQEVPLTHQLPYDIRPRRYRTWLPFGKRHLGSDVVHRFRDT